MTINREIQFKINYIAKLMLHRRNKGTGKGMPRAQMFNLKERMIDGRMMPAGQKLQREARLEMVEIAKKQSNSVFKIT